MDELKYAVQADMAGSFWGYGLLDRIVAGLDIAKRSYTVDCSLFEASKLGYFSIIYPD